MILCDFNVCSDFPYYLNSLFMQFYFSVNIQRSSSFTMTRIRVLVDHLLWKSVCMDMFPPLVTFTTSLTQFLSVKEPA